MHAQPVLSLGASAKPDLHISANEGYGTGITELSAGSSTMVFCGHFNHHIAARDLIYFHVCISLVMEIIQCIK